MQLLKFIKFSLLGLGGATLLGLGAVWGLGRFGTLRFAPRQSVPVLRYGDAAPLKPGQRLKVLTWNVQYMAGKNHVFWYDVQGNDGPDKAPTREEVDTGFARVAALIKAEDPDLVLLQEVDEGSGRSYGEDQLERLRLMLPAYSYSASALYWKAAFVPHPRIMGPVGVKLSVLSKYAIGSARRIALADVPRNAMVQPFQLRRAMLEVRLPVEGGSEFALVDTHLEAFVQGSSVMATQVAQLDTLLSGLDQEGIPWVAAGDLNLLPPGEYSRLDPKERWLYNPESEMALLYAHHAVLPSLEEATGENRKSYWTHYPNRPWANGPDRVIDYMLHSRKFSPSGYKVIQEGTLDISDHLPVVAEFVVP